MKLGIVGVGAVGAATAIAVVLRAQVRELVLVDKNRFRARAIANDMTYGVPLSPLVAIKAGAYEDLIDAGVVVVTAGINGAEGVTYAITPVMRRSPTTARFRERGQAELKDRATSRMVGGPHPSTVGFDDRAANRQAHAHTVGLRCEERIE